MVPDPWIRGGEVVDEPLEVRVADHAEMLAGTRASRAPRWPANCRWLAHRPQ